MKLLALKIRDRLDQPSKQLFTAEEWDIQMDGPLVTLTQRTEGGKTFLVPVSNCVYMVPAKEPKK
jgi:hypothetical protein